MGPSQQAQLGPTLDIVWMCGLNWVWISGLFIGYGLGPNWAPSKQAQLGPTLDIVWMCGLDWVWVYGLFTGYGVGPNWVLANKPSWAPLWILCGCVGLTGFGFLGCLLGMEWAPIGPPASKPSYNNFIWSIKTWKYIMHSEGPQLKHHIDNTKTDKWLSIKHSSYKINTVECTNNNKNLNTDAE